MTLTQKNKEHDPLTSYSYLVPLRPARPSLPILRILQPTQSPNIIHQPHHPQALLQRHNRALLSPLRHITRHSIRLPKEPRSSLRFVLPDLILLPLPLDRDLPRHTRRRPTNLNHALGPLKPAECLRRPVEDSRSADGESTCAGVGKGHRVRPVDAIVDDHAGGDVGVIGRGAEAAGQEHGRPG